VGLPSEARATAQRRAIVDALESFDSTFTAAELHERARRASTSLGLATTYRTLELLRASGAVRSIPSMGGAVYIRCHPGHHHHLVCLRCGSVEDTDLCAAPTARELKRRYGFVPEAHEVEIYGTCARCA
jgi:Fur family ferric uptake transcriptional regulator